MGTVASPLPVMSSPSHHQVQDAKVARVCNQILRSKTVSRPLTGSVVEWLAFVERVLIVLEETRSCKGEMLRLARGMILGEILGIEEISARAPRGEGISDEEFVENLWTGASNTLAAAMQLCWEPTFGAKAVGSKYIYTRYFPVG